MGAEALPATPLASCDRHTRTHWGQGLGQEEPPRASTSLSGPHAGAPWAGACCGSGGRTRARRLVYGTAATMTESASGRVSAVPKPEGQPWSRDPAWVLLSTSPQPSPQGRPLSLSAWTRALTQGERQGQTDRRRKRGVSDFYHTSFRSGFGNQGLDKSWPLGVFAGRTQTESTGFSRGP